MRPTADQLRSMYAYPEPLPARGWVRASMVSSADGAATGPDGRSGSLATVTDSAALATMRGLADVILVGAGTAATEKYGLAEPHAGTAATRAALGQAPVAVMAVLTGSGIVPETLGRSAERARAGAAGDHTRLLVVTTPAGEQAHAGALHDQWGVDAVLVCPPHTSRDGRIDAEWAVDALVQRGLPRVLCEGGPGLLAAVVAAGRLDELCLSVTGRLVGGAAGRIVAGLGRHPGDPAADAVDLTLERVLHDTDTVLTRWRVRR
ncbi:MAG: hypothetical protein CSA58_07520 [Micrococcales bacterium]|nr:MAG: hypothetical protein CSB46_01500 [Micrococcales bacterium]PIE26734.1 MAG: hypothetical protein CSA58_07520 [Micrococcales bacterium]